MNDDQAFVVVTLAFFTIAFALWSFAAWLFPAHWQNFCDGFQIAITRFVHLITTPKFFMLTEQQVLFVFGIIVTLACLFSVVTACFVIAYIMDKLEKWKNQRRKKR